VRPLLRPACWFDDRRPGNNLRMEENPVTPERIAENDATFRVANEGISETAEEYEIDEGLLPFICECADPACTDVTQLTRSEYEEIRANPAYFLNVPGHEVNAKAWGRVVGAKDRYVIVEKLGEAAEIVKAVDPRQAELEAQDGVA
jgi:hypothetical protein